MDSSDRYVGRILDNRYEILELIGSGGMALVYRARCHRLNRMVAIKILKEDLAGDEEFRRRFHTESQAVAMLSHPNIVAVYDVSRSDNIEYIVMELIEGITLKQYINKKGLLNWKEALHFATQVTKALNHAHSRGIIHRDIKPHNIMILKDGSVKVADFGIARLLSVQNTLTQEALGSVHYISPEQAKGGHVDARSDIYSLGVVMYEMLTSRLPFVGESAVSIAIQHISAIPLMPRDINPDIPVGLEDITMHAMEPDINLRFTTAGEMQMDLEEFRKNPSIVFNYAMSDQYDKQQTDAQDIDETRSGAKSPSARPEITAPRREAPAARTERAQATRDAVSHDKASRDFAARKKAFNKPEMTGDEYRTVKTRASNTSALVGVFSVIVFIVIVVVFMWNFFLKEIFNPPNRELITIPTFINRRYEDVVNNPAYQDLYVFIVDRYEYSAGYAEGVIIQQNPTAERQQSPPISGKINVTLVVSNGAEPPNIMPNLVGRHFSYARIELESLAMDLRIEFDVPVFSEMDRGLVVETIPAANEPLTRGTTILIIYSAGPESRSETVPDMVGHSMESLEEAFLALDLIPSFQLLESNEPAGTVLIIQKVNQKVEVPATILVYVSTGPPVATEPPESPGPTTETPDTSVEPADPTPDPSPSPAETAPETPPPSAEPTETTDEPTDPDTFHDTPPPNGDTGDDQ